jgi:hypothetical protein
MIRFASSIVTMALGVVLIVLAGGLARELVRLCEEEGTESFSVAAGPGGIFGCWAFIVLLGFLGGLISCYGIHVLRLQISHAQTFR